MPNEFKFISLVRRMHSAYANWSADSRLNQLESKSDKRLRGELDDEDYDHAEIVNDYYDLCHELMEYGWGDSLHFAPIATNESLENAVVRHQRLMIEKLELEESMRVIDVGCGVGGPMRRVAKEAGVTVYCINNNEYQLSQAKLKNEAAGLNHLAEYVKCSFMDMSSLDANMFDAGYAIESTCHAPDKQHAFAEIFRVLKPGARLWGQEMCLTDNFEPANARHQTLKNELMRGIALKDIASFREVNNMLEAVGFEILEANDLAVNEESSTAWYNPMVSQKGSLGNFFRRTPIGRAVVQWTIRTTEFTGLFPPHAHKVVKMMDRTAEAYVNGGKEGIFTPLYCFVARKPE